MLYATVCVSHWLALVMRPNTNPSLYLGNSDKFKSSSTTTYVQVFISMLLLNINNTEPWLWLDDNLPIDLFCYGIDF